MENILEYWVRTGELRHVRPDLEMAGGLLEEARKRFGFFSELSARSAKYGFEGIYESCRECLDAILLVKGYKSKSHNVSISVSKILGFVNREEEDLLNNAREKRNSSKYYGKSFRDEELVTLNELLKNLFAELSKRTEKLMK